MLLSGDEKILDFFLGFGTNKTSQQNYTERMCVCLLAWGSDVHIRCVHIYSKVPRRQQMSTEIYSVFLSCNCRVMALLSQQSWKRVWSVCDSCGGHRAFGWKLPVCSLHTPFHHIAVSLPPVISTHKRHSVVCVRLPAFCAPSQVSCKRSAEIS